MTIAFGFNQTLDTDIEIPGAVSGSRYANGDSVLRISTGTSRPNDDAPLYSFSDQELVFTTSKVATYRCKPDSIEVTPFPGADAGWVSGLLIATAIPAALWMQGRFVLHAAAIVPKGSTCAIAITGVSGAGKSELARQWLHQGANLLADDSVALELDEQDIIASGLPGGIHCRIEGNAERRFETFPKTKSVKSAPLGAIIILDGFADRFEARSLDKIEAFEKIMTHQHRPRIPAALGTAGEALVHAAAFAERIPVSIWRRRKDEMSPSAVEQESLLALLD